MKVTVPKQIKIGVHNYKVIFCRHLRLDEGFRGECRHRVEEIAIDPAQPQGLINQTFIHEVLHLIDRVFCCAIDDADIDRVAEGIAELLINNLGLELDWSEIETM